MLMLFPSFLVFMDIELMLIFISASKIKSHVAYHINDRYMHKIYVFKTPFLCQ